MQDLQGFAVFRVSNRFRTLGFTRAWGFWAYEPIFRCQWFSLGDQESGGLIKEIELWKASWD